jgi:WD40 repeat protein
MNNNQVKLKESFSLELFAGRNAMNDLDKLKHRFKTNCIPDGVRSVNVCSDRYIIITFESIFGYIRVMDLEILELLPYKYEGHSNSVRLTSLSGNNRLFYTASWDSTSREFELLTGKSNKVFKGHGGRSPSCFSDPSGKYLFTADYSSDLDPEAKNSGKCWDIASEIPIYSYKHPRSKKEKDPEAIDIAYDQKYVYSGGDDSMALKWPLEGGSPIHKYFEFDGTIRKITITEKYFAAACTDGMVRVHWKESGEVFKYFFHSNDQVLDVKISNDETRIYSSSMDGSIACFDLFTGEKIYQNKIHSNWIWSICLMNLDSLLVTGSSDSSVAFLSADTGELLARLHCYPAENQFLFICPPVQKAFPKGFFFTPNLDFVKVYEDKGNDLAPEELKPEDPRRLIYINKLNLKQLISTRIKKPRSFEKISEYFMETKFILSEVNKVNTTLALNK